MTKKLYILILTSVLLAMGCSNGEDREARQASAEQEGYHMPSDDSTPPEIVSIAVYPEQSSLSFEMEASEPVTVSVDYGLTRDLEDSYEHAALSANQSFALSGLYAQTRYYARIRLEDASGNATLSSLFSFTTASLAAGSTDAEPPLPPANLRLPLVNPEVPFMTSANSGTALLQWDASPSDDVAAYHVFRSRKPGVTTDSERIAVLGSGVHVFEDSLTENDLYFYTVVSVDAAGNLSAVAAEVACAKYPSGNVFGLVRRESQTQKYPVTSDPWYQPPQHFLEFDLPDSENSGIPLSVKLAENFTAAEFFWSSRAHAWAYSGTDDNPVVEDSDWGFGFIHPRTVEHLQNIRIAYGSPLSINSSFRTIERNAQIGGATYSRHTHGDAVDIHNPGAGTSNQKKYWDIIVGFATSFYEPDGVYCTSSYGCSGEGASYIEAYEVADTWIHADWRYERK